MKKAKYKRVCVIQFYKYIENILKKLKELSTFFKSLGKKSNFHLLVCILSIFTKKKLFL